MNSPAKILRALFSFMLACCLATGLSACSSSSSSSSSHSSSSKNSASANASSSSSSSSKPQNASQSKPQSAPQSTPQTNPKQSTKYEDERWPTTEGQFTALPESWRYYNARDQIGKTCSIAGPVRSIVHATNSAGSPWFINIGTTSTEVSVVIWQEHASGLEGLFDKLENNENCWVDVSGYLSSYNGTPQFNSSDGSINIMAWSNVK